MTQRIDCSCGSAADTKLKSLENIEAKLRKRISSENCENVRHPFAIIRFCLLSLFTFPTIHQCTADVPSPFCHRPSLCHRSVFPLTSEKRGIIHQGEPKIDTNFMLDGTWACFERQNTCHFVDCHSCTRSGGEREANADRLSFPSRFVVCSSRRRGSDMLQQDPRNDASEIRWKSLRIKAELTSQLMAAGCPRHQSRNVVSCNRLCRHCLSSPPSSTFHASPFALVVFRRQ
jgi:hypothetical protein